MSKGAKIIGVILAILYIILFILFSFDDNSKVGILIHLIPAIALLVCLVFAWVRPKLGGILFLIVGIVFTFIFNTYENIASFLVISLPALVIAVLFLIVKKK